MVSCKKIILGFAFCFFILTCLFAQALDTAENTAKLNSRLALNDSDATLALGLEMLNDNPFDSRVLFAVARAYSVKGDFSQPVEFFRLKKNYTAQDDVALFDLATAYQVNSMPDKALDIFMQLLGLFPERLDVYIAVAEIYGQREDYLTEQKYLRKYMELGGHPSLALYPGTLAYGRRKYYALAREFFLKALSYSPGDTEILNAFGRHYLKLSRFYAFEIHREKAVEMLKKSLELNPDQAEVCFDIASVYREREDFRQARGFFERSLNLGTARKFDAWFALGDGAMADNNIKLAGYYFKLCHEMFPVSPHARQRLAKLSALDGDSDSASRALVWLKENNAPVLARELDDFLRKHKTQKDS